MDATDTDTHNVARFRLSTPRSFGTHRIRKSAHVAPGLVISTLIMLVVADSLPDWSTSILALSGVAATTLLVAGVGEPVATRVIFGARGLTEVERKGLAAAIADLSHLGLGAPKLDLLVARRIGGPAACALGRRSVVMSPELVRGTLFGQLPPREAAAVLAHAALVVRSGLSRQDLAVALWSAPWRTLAALSRPAIGLLGLAWKVRSLVFGVAIWRALAESSQPGQPNNLVVATFLALVGTLTYLIPFWAGRWDTFVVRTADRELVTLGIGQSMAAFLHRLPQTPELFDRVDLLDPPSRQAHLRPVVSI